MYIYRLVLSLLIGIFLFSTAIMEWWIAYGKTWYQPWLLWSLVIVVGYLLQPRGESDEF